MTDKERDLGRVISVSVLLLILLIAMFTSGCAPYMYKSNQIKVTHVLALTERGDTVKIAMRDIQPTQVYNVVGYDFVRGYNNPYYNPWRQYQLYDNHYRYYGNSFVTKVHYSASPTLTPPVVANSNGSNTTGGNGAPVAVNPVTQGGSSRGKNN